MWFEYSRHRDSEHDNPVLHRLQRHADEGEAGPEEATRRRRASDRNKRVDQQRIRSDATG
jgi:hypothetical protein